MLKIADLAELTGIFDIFSGTDCSKIPNCPIYDKENPGFVCGNQGRLENGQRAPCYTSQPLISYKKTDKTGVA